MHATPLTESDNICRAFAYAFEREGKALELLLQLIETEVATADTTATLFRSNSISTKFFKAYSRLVGLPYLFRVLAPLLTKLMKDEEKLSQGVTVQGNNENMISIKDATNALSENYELNPNMVGNAAEFETIIEANSLSIQLTCQMFLTTLSRTSSYCPIEFKRMCAAIKENVKQKFPEHKHEIALSSFIFLRFFVAGLSVPETFGIIEKPPSQSLRRQFILISKVLSNLSTNVLFGDKEDYMVIMNPFLESRKDDLDPYYDLLCTDDPSKAISPVEIPDKYYNGAIEVLSIAAHKVETNEWVGDEAEQQQDVY
jgi:neurofibromin 1